MRRWVCIVTLLAGFGTEARGSRRPVATPAPIVRSLNPSDGRTVRTLAWWRP